MVFRLQKIHMYPLFKLYAVNNFLIEDPASQTFLGLSFAESLLLSYRCLSVHREQFMQHA